MKKLAFTLAEVLLTLVIIGIIAAMTISPIIQTTQKKQFVAGLLKANSTLSRATLMAKNDVGENELDSIWADSTFGYNTLQLYKKHLSIAKDCGSGTGCWPKEVLCLDGSVFWSDWDAYYAGRYGKAVLTDGSAIMFDGSYIYVDVNGSKAPNQLGRDIFQFAYFSDKHHLLPLGTGYANLDLQCNTTTAAGKYAQSCPAKIIMEGEMNY